MSSIGAHTGMRTPEERARNRARYLSGLLWHTGAFLIINAAFWALDLGVGRSGLQWAFWITAVWGFALAFHALAYTIDGRGIEDRKVEQYLAATTRHTNEEKPAAEEPGGESNPHPTDQK